MALEELAYNLRWSWHQKTIDLFRRLDRDLWESCGHNPVLILGTVAQDRLAELAQDDAFLARMDAVIAGLRLYVGSGTWYDRHYGRPVGPLIAYFSLEFGLTESLPIYSGGLGILAGDHLKSASELGVPLVGVGLLYQRGYFRQYLTSDGWQQERQPSNDFSVMPLRPCYGPNGLPIRVQVDLAGRTLQLRPWHAQVGRITLLLLDANLPENPSDLQDVTGGLYSGDSEMRIRQEIVLGVGGVRALAAVGLKPAVFHMNEGHCAFLGLERIRELVQGHGISFLEALEIVAASGVFTTHTPVPAGIDVFSPDQIERYFAPLRIACGLSREAFLDLGRTQPAGPRNSSTWRSSPCTPPAQSMASAVCTPASRGQCGRDSGRAFPSTRSRSRMSPTVSTRAPGSRMRWARSTTTISARTGPNSRAIRGSGGGPSRSRPTSCGGPTSGGASAWSPWRGGASGCNCAAAAPRSVRWRKGSARWIRKR
jgi:starch phosphorylase